MLKGYRCKTSHVLVQRTGSPKTKLPYPTKQPDVKFSAGQSDALGRPSDVFVLNGIMYPPANPRKGGAKPYLIGLPGRVELRDTYTEFDLTTCRFISTGQAMLTRSGSVVRIDDRDDSLCASESIPRLIVGVDTDGKLVLMHETCTAYEAQLAMHDLGIPDSALMASGPFAYLEAKGERMGTQPLTFLEAQSQGPLSETIIVIDPGHGGTDPGASGNGIVEKFHNHKGGWIAARYLASNYECSVLMTRKDDTYPSLQERVLRANNIKADLFWSIHANANPDPKGNGFESLSADKCGPTTEALHVKFHTEAAKVLGKFDIKDRGRKKRSDLYVLNHTNMPAILTECAFVSNPHDAAVIADEKNMWVIYEGMAEAMAKALGLKKRTSQVTEKKFRVAVEGLTYVQAQAVAAQIEKLGYKTNITE